jgi:hypothetical protein
MTGLGGDPKSQVDSFKDVRVREAVTPHPDPAGKTEAAS